MSTFIKVRVATLIWGFTISLIFTGELYTASLMFGIIVVGNTLIMKYFIK